MNRCGAGKLCRNGRLCRELRARGAMRASAGLDMDFRAFIETAAFPAEEIERRTAGIHATLLAESDYIDQADFTALHSDDLSLLFQRYDQLFFQGSCAALVGSRPLDFRVSSRMTRIGGKTTTFRPRAHPSERRYEIAVSSTLLFQTFRDEDREITVNGLRCHNRLQALQRVFEHELLHLVETLVWSDSSCKAQRFQDMAARLFGHREHTHRLITPRERALTRFRVRPGVRVRFEFEGRPHVGIVNRVTNRATVLVEDPGGLRYSNGKRYRKFYVPVGGLQVLDAG